MENRDNQEQGRNPFFYIIDHMPAADIYGRVRVLFRWLFLGCMTGAVVGVIGALFSKAIVWATHFRTEHDLIILGLPFAGLLIVFLYRACNRAAL